MRQGLLSEPEASSGPAAITPSHGVLVVPPDVVPARSDATFLWCPSTTSTSQNLKNIPACIHPRSDATFLWRPSPSFSQNLKSIPDCIHRAIPPSSDVPRPHPYTPKKSPASSYSKDTGLPSVIYKLEMRLELTTPSLRVKCSTD